MEERDRLRVAKEWTGPSPKRFSGWEPRQFHDFYDENGERCPMAQAWTVVVTTEPEWDARTAGLAEGLAQYDQDCCPGCGLHKAILDDPDRHRFEFDETLCSVCAASAVKQRLLDEADQDWDKKHENVRAGRQRPYDGRHVRLRQLSPLEVLTQQAR